LKIIAISDTHQKHGKIKVPDGDVFIFAGDMTNFNRSRQHYISFNNWLGTLPHLYKLCIAGNHDELFQKQPEVARSLMTNCIYLEDSEVVIDGIKFYGSPWQNWYYDWAFNLPKNSKELKEKWAMIPKNTDVLITHSPPYQICDDDLGCELLTDRVFEVRPKLHIFGHIHQNGGQYKQYGNTLFYNVSYNNKTNSCYIIDLDNKKAKPI
jgi:Icc-related predicted phosphoesterase